MPDTFRNVFRHHRIVGESVSLIHGIVLGSFLLFGVNFFIACVVYVQKRHARLAAEKGLTSHLREASSLGAAMFVEGAVMISAFVLVFDYVMYFRDAAKQIQTVNYVAGDAEISKCREIVKQDGEETSRELDVEYLYSVDGRDFRGAILRHLKIGTEASRTEFIWV